jgi:hypothetical protein
VVVLSALAAGLVLNRAVPGALPTRCAQLRQIDTSRPWTATAQITNTSTEMMSSAQNG